MILFVDDDKLPEWFGLDKDVIHAKTYQEAEAEWNGLGGGITLFLDYDLDYPKKGDELLEIFAPSFQFRPQQVFCISLNGVGVEKIRKICERYAVPFVDIGRKVMFDNFSLSNVTVGI